MLEVRDVQFCSKVRTLSNMFLTLFILADQLISWITEFFFACGGFECWISRFNFSTLSSVQLYLTPHDLSHAFFNLVNNERPPDHWQRRFVCFLVDPVFFLKKKPAMLILPKALVAPCKINTEIIDIKMVFLR